MEAYTPIPLPAREAMTPAAREKCEISMIENPARPFISGNSATTA